MEAAALAVDPLHSRPRRGRPTQDREDATDAVHRVLLTRRLRGMAVRVARAAAIDAGAASRRRNLGIAVTEIRREPLQAEFLDPRRMATEPPKKTLIGARTVVRRPAARRKHLENTPLAVTVVETTLMGHGARKENSVPGILQLIGEEKIPHTNPMMDREEESVDREGTKKIGAREKIRTTKTDRNRKAATRHTTRACLPLLVQWIGRTGILVGALHTPIVAEEGRKVVTPEGHAVDRDQRPAYRRMIQITANGVVVHRVTFADKHRKVPSKEAEIPGLLRWTLSAEKNVNKKSSVPADLSTNDYVVLFDSLVHDLTRENLSPYAVMEWYNISCDPKSNRLTLADVTLTIVRL